MLESAYKQSESYKRELSIQTRKFSEHILYGNENFPTKGYCVMSSTKVLHARYNSLYLSLPLYAKQTRTSEIQEIVSGQGELILLRTSFRLYSSNAAKLLTLHDTPKNVKKKKKKKTPGMQVTRLASITHRGL